MRIKKETYYVSLYYNQIIRGSQEMHGDQQTEVNAKIDCKFGVNWSILQV